MSEKTEQPTPKKLRDARKKGQVAKSKEVATCAAIVGLMVLLWLALPYYMERLKILVQVPAQFFEADFDQAMTTCFKVGFQEFILITLPFTLVAAVIAMLSYFLQFGFLLSFEAVTPDIKKIDPMQGIKRIFSMNNLLELVKSIVKIVLLGTIVYLLIKDNIPSLLAIPTGGLQAAQQVLTAVLHKMVVAVSVLFIIVAILDFFLQKTLHIRKLKMSKDDIKKEHKDQEGDPHVKGHRRQLQMEMAMDDMANQIKQSTMVLTRPGKQAVVIYYEQGITPLPIITVKGQNRLAARILEIAKKHGLPVFPDAALTRRLFQNCQQGQYVSSEYIQPVAVYLRKALGIES